MGVLFEGRFIAALELWESSGVLRAILQSGWREGDSVSFALLSRLDSRGGQSRTRLQVSGGAPGFRECRRR